MAASTSAKEGEDQLFCQLSSFRLPLASYRLPKGFPYTTIAVLLPLNLSHVQINITSSFVIAFKILF